MSDLKFNYATVTFDKSAENIRQLCADEGIEIAFAGRSNAGKSSALNTLTRQKSLARTSKTPGRTQLINVFRLDDNRRLIDLPGYGFAKVPIEVKNRWQRSLSEYLVERKSLKGLVVLMDIRHPMRDLDQDLIYWAVDSNIPVLVLLTKADKLKTGKRKAELLKIREASLAFQGDVTVHVFSSLKGIGVDVLSHKLNEWYSAQRFSTDPVQEDQADSE